MELDPRAGPGPLQREIAEVFSSFELAGRPSKDLLLAWVFQVVRGLRFAWEATPRAALGGFRSWSV